MVVGAERGRCVDPLAVAKDVDVAADRAVLVEDPAGGLGPRRLERAQHVADRVARDVEVAVAPGEVFQRGAKGHHRHRTSLPLASDTGYPAVAAALGVDPYSRCIPSGVRNLPPQMNPHRSKIRTMRGSIVGSAPYGFWGALMSIAAP